MFFFSLPDGQQLRTGSIAEGKEKKRKEKKRQEHITHFLLNLSASKHTHTSTQVSAAYSLAPFVEPATAAREPAQAHEPRLGLGPSPSGVNGVADRSE